MSPFAFSSAGVKRGSVVTARDHLHAVAELEELRDRLAVAGGRGHLVDPHRVGRAVVGEEDDVVERAARHDGDDLRRLRATRVVSIDASRPTRLIQPSRVSTTFVFSRTMYASSSKSSTSSSEAMRVLRRSPNFSIERFHLVLDDAPQPPLRREDRLDLLGLRLLLLQLVEDLLDLHLGDLVKLRVEDRVGLLVVELERAYQFLGRVRLAARSRG